MTIAVTAASGLACKVFGFEVRYEAISDEAVARKAGAPDAGRIEGRPGAALTSANGDNSPRRRRPDSP